MLTFDSNSKTKVVGDHRVVDYVINIANFNDVSRTRTSAYAMYETAADNFKLLHQLVPLVRSAVPNRLLKAKVDLDTAIILNVVNCQSEVLTFEDSHKLVRRALEPVISFAPYERIV